MAIFKPIKKSQSFEDLFLSFFKNNDILKPRSSSYKRSMSKAFSEYKEISSYSFHELKNLCDENPQLLINVVRDTFTTEIFTTIITNTNRNINTITDKMSIIAIMWEVSSINRLPAFIVSRRKAPITSLVAPIAVYKQLKVFGLSSKDIEKIRLIRNAKNHKYNITKGYLKYNNKGEEIKISTDDISMIYEKMDTIFSWCNTFLFYCIAYLPIFGILFCYTLIMKLLTSGRNDVKNYVDGLEDFIPDELWNPKKEISLLMKVKKAIRKTIKRMKRKKNKIFHINDFKAFFKNHGVYVLKRLAYHMETISTEITDISCKLSNKNDRMNFFKMSKWFEKYRHAISKISDQDWEKIIAQKYK